MEKGILFKITSDDTLYTYHQQEPGQGNPWYYNGYVKSELVYPTRNIGASSALREYSDMIEQKTYPDPALGTKWNTDLWQFEFVARDDMEGLFIKGHYLGQYDAFYVKISDVLPGSHRIEEPPAGKRRKLIRS